MTFETGIHSPFVSTVGFKHTNMKKVFWIILIAVVLVGGFFLLNSKSSYNNMVDLQEQVDAQRGQVQNAYQRRADLIPNVVNTVKGYAQFEQETFTGVAEARAKVGQLTLTREVLEDPRLMERFTEAQNQLGQTLSRLLSVAENYPDLKANENFKALITELEGSENRIATERKRYNDVAREYNSYVKKFPAVIFAKLFGFEPVDYFQSTQGAEQAPQVNF